MNQPLYSSYSSCYLYLPHAFIFICIHQSIHHHSSPRVPLALFLPVSMAVSLVLPAAYGDIGVVTLGFMRHVMVCVITVFTPPCVSVCFTMCERIYMIVTVQERVFLLLLIKIWTCYWGTLLCWCLFVFPVPPTVCESMCECGRVRQTVWFLLFGLIWCDWAPLSLFTHLFSSELTTKQ